MSQGELAKLINTSRIMVGKCERIDNSSSIEIFAKLAKAFGVSLDYLVGEGAKAAFDKEVIARLENMESLLQEEDRIFHFIDLIVRDHKAKQAYS